MKITLSKLEATSLICQSAQIHIQDNQSRIAIKSSGNVETVPLQSHTDKFAVNPQNIANQSTLPDFNDWIDVYKNGNNMIEYQKEVVNNTRNQEIELEARKGIDEDEREVITVELN